MTTKRHKHAELIHAWAEGAEIEILRNEIPPMWEMVQFPSWADKNTYRIKQVKKPDVVWYGNIYQDTCGLEFWRRQQQVSSDNIRLTFDGETGKLIKAEVL